MDSSDALNRSRYRKRRLINFTCGLIYDFDLIVNCDNIDQRRLTVGYL